MVVKIFRIGRVSAENHLHGLIEVVDSFSQPMKVEVVSDVIFIDFDKEFVTLEVTKPLNPTGSGFAVVLVV